MKSKKVFVGVLLVLLLLLSTTLVLAASSARVYGNLDTNLLDGKQITFQKDQKFVGKSKIVGSSYGIRDPIILNGLTFGDKVQIHIEGKYVGILDINSKIIEKNLRARHLVSEIMSGKSEDVVIDPEQYAKSKKGLFYMIMSVLVFAGFLATGLVFAVKSGVIRDEGNFLSKFKIPSQNKSNDFGSQQYEDTTQQSQFDDETHPHENSQSYAELGISQQAADSLRHYYEYYKQQGYDDAHIREALIKAGWKREVLDKIL
ncbi:hypothetical protein KY334_06465 [Candidatus Woesearchaeota archaeon]|nr:hypothetical protein [Candidatus Woesearchaeota archaeon]